MHANRMVTDTLRLLVKNETKIGEKIFVTFLMKAHQKHSWVDFNQNVDVNRNMAKSPF